MMRYKDKGKQYAFNAWTARGQEITKLKKALKVANTVVNLSCHIRTESEAEIVEECAREAQKQIKEIMEG